MSATRSFASYSTALVLAASSPLLFAAGPYETPSTLRASEVLPAEVLSSATHQVAEQVRNDGFMNHYQLNSRLGSLEAHSDAELRKRVAELAAAEELDKLSKTEEFGKHLAGGAERIVSGAEALITNPVDTVSGALGGVGRMFENANESLFGVGSGDEDKLKALIGFNEKKREYAKAFGVDVYSRNPILQARLEDVAWAGYAGGITTTAATMAVSGGAGAALSVSSGAELLNRDQLDRPPVELRKANHTALAGMGVGADVAELFLDNKHFTLTQATLFVNALTRLEGAAGRDGLVKLAVSANSPQVAEFRRRQAQMYAAMHTAGPRFILFETAGQVSTARTGAGGLAFALPVDHLLWTQALDNLASAAAKGDASSRTLHVAGRVSDRARAELEALGWAVIANGG